MRVTTWNMQGATGAGESKWNADVKRLFSGFQTDVVCLQECGAPPATAQAIAGAWLPGFAAPVGVNAQLLQWNIRTSSRPDFVFIFWVHCDPGNRCNLAIVSNTMPANLIYIPPGLAGGRPSIGAQFLLNPATGVLGNIFTVHAFSPGGNDAPQLLANISAAPAPWFVGGDFNRQPNTWGALPPNMALCGHNNDPTHPGTGTNLDYAFISPAFPVQGTVMSQFVVSDHYPVVYDI